MEIEIVSPLDLPIGKYGSHSRHDALGPLPAGTTFPRYSVGPPDEFLNLSQTFGRDVWNGAGRDFPDVVTVDFERALRELGIHPDVSP